MIPVTTISRLKSLEQVRVHITCHETENSRHAYWSCCGLDSNWQHPAYPLRRIRAIYYTIIDGSDKSNGICNVYARIADSSLKAAVESVAWFNVVVLLTCQYKVTRSALRYEQGRL